MMKTSIDFKVKDIVQEEKNITEDVQMTSRGSINVHIRNVRNFMDLRDRLTFILKLSTMEVTKQIGRRWPRLL